MRLGFQKKRFFTFLSLQHVTVDGQNPGPIDRAGVYLINFCSVLSIPFGMQCFSINNTAHSLKLIVTNSSPLKINGWKM